jgi:hypothetical protein
MGPSLIKSSSYDKRMKALVTTFLTLDDQFVLQSAQKPFQIVKETSDLRHRKEKKQQEPLEKVENLSIQMEPLNWFGFLPSPSLKDAQVQFKEGNILTGLYIYIYIYLLDTHIYIALQQTIQLASINYQLHRLLQEYQDLSRKHHL